MYESCVLVWLDWCSADRGGQPSGLIVTQGPQRLKRHVAPLQLPLIVLLEQQRADEPRDRGFVREGADDVGTTPYLGVEYLSLASDFSRLTTVRKSRSMVSIFLTKSTFKFSLASQID